MRLTTLLDTLNQGGSGPWPATSAITAPPTEAEAFDPLCQECPLREGCLAGAVARSEPWGVWGGEVFVDGVVVPRKRGRGRPRKDESTAA